MTKHISKSISTRPKRDLLADDIATITRLVATLPSGRRKLDDDTRFRLAHLQHCPLFFCPALKQLEDRAKAIHEASKRAKSGGPPIYRKDFESLANGKPLNLDKILSIYRASKAISESRNAEIRSTIQVASARKPLLLKHNDIVPSLFWVNKTQVNEFRKDYNMKRGVLGKLIFGDNPQTARIMVDLHHGVRKSGARYDYRITEFTCEHIYFGLQTMFNRLPRFGRPLAMAMPPRSQFFVLSHTVGAGQGRRKLALPIAKGNRMTSLTLLERAQIEARVDAYAARIG
jgi:hypothetical protein